MEYTALGGVISPSVISDPNRLESSFMYCQLLKEKFLKIRYDKSSIEDFISFCRSRKIDPTELKEFEKTYGKNLETESPIWWYSKPMFLYQMLNKALRELDMETLMKINFFIRDLHEQIQQRFDRNQYQIPSIVYRGQTLPRTAWNKIKESIGGLYYFNCFLSTSIHENVASAFGQTKDDDEAFVKILFKININRSNASVPFTYIEDITAVKSEHEILFSIGSVFRIGRIDEMKTNLWQVDLTLCQDRDPSLTRLMVHIRRSLGEGSEWRQLGQLMIKMGHFQIGKQVFLQLCRPPAEPVEFMFAHNQLGYCEKQLAHFEEALNHYQKVIDISRQISMQPLDARLSSTYSNIGVICKLSKDYDKALKYFRLVLQIDQNAKTPDQLEIAVDYNNIGSVFDEQNKYTEALEYYQKALEIKSVHLPSSHPSLANSYLNIGVVYRKINDLSGSLKCYEKALDIQKRSLPPNHPSFINTYNNMSTVYSQLDQHAKALECVEEAVNIAKLSLGPTHPETIRYQEMVRKLREN